MKSSLVISGGGSKGAYGAGVLNALNKDYDYYLGTSTGALLVALACCGKTKQLKELYTTGLDTNSIYSKNPYNSKGGLRIFRGIKRLLFDKRSSLGDTTPLLRLIRDNFTEEDYNKVVESNKELIVTVTNMDFPECEYKSIRDYNYLDFTLWLWTSTLGYPITNKTNINGINYADGGHTVPIPLSLACKMSDEVDAIILNTENNSEVFEPNNLLDGILDLVKMKMRYDTIQEFEEANKVIKSKERLKIPFKINYFYTPYKLTNKEFFFDKCEMLDWYNLGLKVNEN